MTDQHVDERNVPAAVDGPGYDVDVAAKVGDPVPDPGLPAHEPRPTDVDERAEKRAERQIATLFGLSSVLALLFIVFYFWLRIGDNPTIIAGYGASTVALGLTLGLALMCIGVGAIQWARKLMNDEEIVEQRHPAASSPEDREEALAKLSSGISDSGIARRPLIRNSLLGALGTIGLPIVLMLRDLGPLPGNALAHTVWKKGMRLVNDVAGTPIKPEDMQIGQLVNGEPAVFFEERNGEPLFEGTKLLTAKAKAAIIIVRMLPSDITPAKGRENWGVDGISVLLQDLHPRRVPDLAVGAADAPPALPLPPVDLRPRRQRQSDLRPRGPLAAAAADHDDGDGYLVARSDFTEPVGPSYWERG